MLSLFTLTFDSSPIKGEGVYGWCWLCSPSPLIPLPSRERGYMVVLACSPSDPVSSTGTGSLIPLPSRERGYMVGCFRLVSPHPVVSRLRGNDGEGREE